MHVLPTLTLRPFLPLGSSGVGKEAVVSGSGPSHRWWLWRQCEGGWGGVAMLMVAVMVEVAEVGGGETVTAVVAMR